MVPQSSLPQMMSQLGARVGLILIVTPFTEFEILCMHGLVDILQERWGMFYGGGGGGGPVMALLQCLFTRNTNLSHTISFMSETIKKYTHVSKQSVLARDRDGGRSTRFGKS